MIQHTLRRAQGSVWTTLIVYPHQQGVDDVPIDVPLFNYVIGDLVPTFGSTIETRATIKHTNLRENMDWPKAWTPTRFSVTATDLQGMPSNLLVCDCITTGIRLVIPRRYVNQINEPVVLLGMWTGYYLTSLE